MRKTILALTGAAAFLAQPALAPLAFAQAPPSQAAADPAGPVTAQGFVENAARSDMYEIAAAKIALERSHDPAIQRFARRMIQDHSATSAKLEANLPEGLSLPTDLGPRLSGMLDELKTAAPGEFDRRYAAQQVAAHVDALALLRGYARHGDNPVLQRLAANTVPMVEMHLKLAHKLPGAPR